MTATFGMLLTVRKLQFGTRVLLVAVTIFALIANFGTPYVMRLLKQWGFVDDREEREMQVIAWLENEEIGVKKIPLPKGSKWRFRGPDLIWDWGPAQQLIDDGEAAFLAHALGKAFRHPQRDIQLNAAYCLHRLRKHTPVADVELEAALDSPLCGVPEWAAGSLSSHASEKTYLAMLRHDLARVRRASAIGVYKHGERSKDLSAALNIALKDDDESVRCYAAMTLLDWEDSEQAVEVLVAVSQGSNEDLAEMAHGKLAVQRPELVSASRLEQDGSRTSDADSTIIDVLP